MFFKLIFLDIDGTITDEFGNIPNESLDAIRNLRKCGYKIIACSANAYFVLRTLNRYFALFDYIIAENGGVIDIDGNPIILGNKSLSLKALKEIMNNFKSLKEHWSNPIRLSDQALMRPNDDKLINEIKTFAEKLSDLNIKVMDTGFSLVINEKRTSKVHAAKILIEKLGISDYETYAIGDSEVDIEIFRFAKKPFALSNSHIELKENAIFIAKESYYRGFLEITKKLIES